MTHTEIIYIPIFCSHAFPWKECYFVDSEMVSLFTPVYFRFILESCATLFHLTDETINQTYLISRMTLKAIPRVQKVKVNAGCVLHGFLKSDFTLEIVTVMN